MDLNFGILNKTLFLPTLSDQNNTGPLDVNKIIKAINIIGNMSINRTIDPSDKSKIRFILYHLYFF